MTAKSDSKPYGVIYCITNTVNGKKYIGQTVQPLGKRWRMHKQSKSCRLLHRAIDKHGADAFTVDVLDGCESKEALDSAELMWILKLDTVDPAKGYNLKEGGSSRRYSAESRALMSDSARTRLASDSAREKISARRKEECKDADMAHFKGKLHTEKSRLQISETLKATFASESAREMLSASKKKMWESAEYRANVVAARIGLKHSDATKEKMSIARKAYWSAKKAAQI